MKVGLQISSFTWPGGPEAIGPTLARVARQADDVGFDSIWVMDHFFQIRGVGSVEEPMLEGMTTLGFMAAHSTRARLGLMVGGVHYRNPALWVKAATTLDVLSGGRAWLGIGAAWNEQESRGLGIPFPPMAERFERLEETLRTVHQMWAGDPRPFEGRHYRLEQPLNVPNSLRRPHPPILVGGSGERKTLRLVARYADACNLYPTPDLPAKLDVLRRHCAEEGRDYDAIEKTCMVHFAIDGGDTKTRELIAELQRLGRLGIETVIGILSCVDPIASLETISREVIPVVAEE